MSDFFLPVVLSAAPDNTLVAAVQQVLVKAQQTLPWLPNLAQESSSLFYGSPPRFPRLAYDPDGLDDGQTQQWHQVYNAMVPIASAALRGEMKAAAVQGEQLAVNVNFWNTVYRVTEDVATLGIAELWTKLWEAVDACKASYNATTVTLQQTQEALSALSDSVPSDLVTAQYDLQNENRNLASKVTSTLAPLGQDAVDHAGFGSALVIAGITGAVVVAITASVWAVAHELASVQKQANDHAQAVFDAQTAYDQNLADQGIISQDELMRRRSDTARQVQSVADAQGAAAVGTGLQKAGMGAALGIGALALGAIAVLYLLRRSKGGAASTPAINPRYR